MSDLSDECCKYVCVNNLEDDDGFMLSGYVCIFIYTNIGRSKVEAFEGS